MKPYFFIPASKFDKIKSIPNDVYKIIDFEDSILLNRTDDYLKKISLSKDFNKLWYRIFLRDNFEDNLKIDLIRKFISLNINKLVIPKLKSYEEFKKIEKATSNCDYIILIEHPRMLIDINKVLKKYAHKNHIKAIGIGTHDYITFTKGNEKGKNFDFIRLSLLNICKAYEVPIIDYASMNINDKNIFIDSLNESQLDGFESKFLVHPNQLNWFFEKNKIVQDENVLWAKKIVSKISDINNTNIEPFVLDGQIIEKPHIIQAINILKNAN